MKQYPYSVASLRQNAWQFLTGKLFSGFLVFFILLWLVRLLPVADYGVYISLLATAELICILSGLGLPWVAARFMPMARLQASRSELSSFIWYLLRLRIGILFFTSIVIWFARGILITSFDLIISLISINIWVVLVFMTGCSRHLREDLLGPLMQQGLARASLVLQQVSFLIFISLLVVIDETRLSTILAAEVLARILGASLAFIGLIHHLHTLDVQKKNTNWKQPNLHMIWRVALPMYSSQLLSLTYSPKIFLLLLLRFAGAEVAAVFGFLSRLYFQVARYLPATLLFSLVRPKLVASYINGGVEKLSSNANLAGKLSLFILMPAICFSLAEGDHVVRILSGGKFTETGYLLFGFMIALIPYSQRQLFETVAVTIGQATLCTVGASVGVLVLPVMLWLLFHWHAGPWAGLAALGMGDLFFVISVGIGLVSYGHYSLDLINFLKLFFAALITSCVCLLFPRFTSLWLELFTVLLVSGSIFVGVCLVVKPFTRIKFESLKNLVTIKRELNLK